MTKEELIEKTRRLLADEFEVEVENITPEADIKKTLDLDSLSLVDLIALIEQEFEVKIKGAELANVKIFSELYDLLQSRIEQK